MEYTKYNYLYGIGSGDDWHVNIDPPKRKVRTYYEETIEAVDFIYNNKVGKFTVLLSGGLDSHYVCEVLLRMGIDFDVIIIEYLDNQKKPYNDHDTVWAYEFCKSKNISPRTIYVNFDKIVESGEAIAVAKSVQCCSFVTSTFLSVISNIDGFLLMGNDPPYLRYEKNTNIWVLLEVQFTHALIRFFKKNNINGCPFILSYTPEMMLSFLLDPTIVKLGTEKIPGKLGSNSSKSYVFNNGSNFNMPCYDHKNKTRIKLYGFENIDKRPIIKHDNLKIFEKDFQKKWNGEYTEPYNDLIDRLSVYQ